MFILLLIYFIGGFRAFVLCESGSGYVLNWFLDRSSQIVIINNKYSLYLKMSDE